MTRRPWPISLQHLLASTTNACKCGAELQPLDGFVCATCRESRRSASLTVAQPEGKRNQEYTRGEP